MSQTACLQILTASVALAVCGTAGAVCAPAVELSGDSMLVAEVQDILFHQGIAAAIMDCPAVRGHLARLDDAIVLTVEDPHGHKSTREVANAEIAALVIETWARDDLLEPLLQTFRLVPASDKLEIKREVAEVFEEIQQLPKVLAPDFEPEWGSGFSFGLLMTSAASNDGALWLGAVATGCVPLDAFCVGGLLRVSVDTELTGETRRRETERDDVDVMATAEVPIRWSRVALVPGLGVGVQLFQSSIDSEETGGAPLVFQGSALSLGASLRAALAIGRRSLIDVGLFAELSPFAHTETFSGEGFVVVGEPLFMVHGGIGFRYGAP